uniref:ADP-ribosylation factor-like protein 2-binding protein n=1 Tax=Schistocephalus solidus TaxID=70667 RepID=A0A0X3P045_SCHSO
MYSGDSKPQSLASTPPDDEEEVIFASNEPTSDFDVVVGHLEDIMISDEFQTIQDNFIKQHCELFEDIDENKLCYTEIHNKYVLTVESFLENELRKKLPDFSMKEFIAEVGNKNDALDGEVFEMLITFTDFMAFKELMIDYKKSLHGVSTEFLLSNAYACHPGELDPINIFRGDLTKLTASQTVAGGHESE